jgi:predicted XRE-type DNA-binding protein
MPEDILEGIVLSTPEENDAELPECRLPDDPEPEAPTQKKVVKSIAKTAGDVEDTALETRRPRGVRTLTYRQVLHIAQYLEEGKLSQAEIARNFNINQSTVCRIGQEYRDTRDAAKLVARREAKTMMTNLMATANNDAQLEVLDRLDVLPKKPKEGSGTKLHINVGGSVDRLGVQVNNGFGID